jgi:DNA-binding Lrp family transcriptional regulator
MIGYAVEMPMDDTDRKLITLLRVNARTPVATLAKALKVSRGTVQNRIGRMLARGDIGGFTIRLRDQSNRVRAIMAVAVEGERSGAVLRALRGFPEVRAVHMTNGRWDIIAELETDSLAGFSAALDAIRLVEGISATETSLLLATHQT